MVTEMTKTEFDEMVYRWSARHEMPHSTYQENAERACKNRIENFFMYYSPSVIHKFMRESNEDKRERWLDFLQHDFDELKTCLQYLYGYNLGAGIEED